MPPRPRFFGVLGPEPITGGSDDNQVAIGTCSQTVAAFGYGLCWLPLLCWPLMAAVQEISGRIGCIAGRGLAGAVGRDYPAPLFALAVLVGSWRDVRGAFAVGWPLRAAGWATVALLAGSAGAMAVRGASR